MNTLTRVILVTLLVFLLGLLGMGIVNAQTVQTPVARTIKVGTVYWAVDTTGLASVYEVWNSMVDSAAIERLVVVDTAFIQSMKACPAPAVDTAFIQSLKPPVTITIIDSMWQVGTGWSPVKPIVTPPASGPLVSIFTTQTLPTVVQNDAQTSKGITLGMKFKSSVAGFVRGVRFYKVAGNAGTHTGYLYDTTGKVLASMQFTETASGWQTATFTTAIPINANQTYVAAEFSSLGNYSSTTGGLNAAITNAPLTATASTAKNLNAVYNYGSTVTYPTSNYQGSNYWTDVVFSTTAQ